MKAGIRKNKLKKGFSYTVFIDYGVVNGHRKREPLETFSDKRIAEKYKAKTQNEIDNNNFVRITDMNFGELIDEWMENHVSINCEPNTYEAYKTVNETYLKPCLGHIPCKILSSPKGTNIINDYYKYLRFDLQKNGRKNLSYSTVEHHKAQISGALAYGILSQKITNNSCTQSKIPKTENEKTNDIIIDNVENFEDTELYEDEKFITPEQAVQVLNLFMNTPMMVPVFLAALVGLRRSEIAGILKNAINKEQQTLKIKTVRVKCGKKTIFKKKTKNGPSSRIVYLPNMLLKILELDKKRQEENKRLYKDKYIETNFLCVMDNGRPIRVNHMSEKFKKVFDKFIKEETEKANKEGKDFKFPYITLHKLRHLNISALLANGAYLTDVQDNAGHSTIKTTMGYTHHYTKGKKEIANITDKIYKHLIKTS